MMSGENNLAWCCCFGAGTGACECETGLWVGNELVLDERWRGELCILADD